VTSLIAAAAAAAAGAVVLVLLPAGYLSDATTTNYCTWSDLVLEIL